VTLINLGEESTSFGTVSDVTYKISDTWYGYDDEDGWFRVNETSTITADSDTQTGTKVTTTTVINSQQVEYLGFLSGSTYTFMRSYPDDGGTVSQVFTLDLSNSGTGSGSCDWVWNDAYEDCGGRFDIAMTRAPLTIRASAGSGGSISPSGSVSVPYGGS
jgi:hypothetical protein